jgi:REP-associated tyrosine transposase
MHDLNAVYARAFNELHGVDGYLFDRRFRAGPVETEIHLSRLYRYLAFNPVRAGLCERPSDWPWSGFRTIDGRPFRIDE